MTDVAPERRQRHNHPGIIVTVIVCFFMMLATQGLVVRKASNAAQTARDGVELLVDLTDPNCDTSHAACQRAREQANGGQVVADINDVSVIGAFCARRFDELEAVRTCVGDEFRRLTGRLPTIATSTTTTSRR